MMTKNMMANPVLMSLVAAVDYTSSLLKGFHLIARVGAGFIGNNTYAHET